MTTFFWEIEYDGTTILDDVLTVSISRGKQQIQDPFRPGTAVVTGRNLAGLPTIEIGVEVIIWAGDPSTLTKWKMFQGIVADISKNYGFVTSEDTWTITLEDILAKLGRSYSTSSFSWSAGITTGQAAQNIVQNATDSTVSIGPFGSYAYSSTVSAQSLANANALQVVNELCATEQGFLFCESSVVFVPRSAIGGLGVNGIFSDGTVTEIGAVIKFDQVQFKSFADSYYDRVVVEPEGLAAQSKGTGVRTFTLQSYDQSTTQAGNLADYVKATLDVQQSAPQSISCVSSTQSGFQVLQTADVTSSFARIKLNLRGSSYLMFLLGCTISVTPEQSRFTFNVASADALNFFILDSATFGVLDTNKLGF